MKVIKIQVILKDVKGVKGNFLYVVCLEVTKQYRISSLTELKLVSTVRN
jgi:hypothetical protein